MIFRNAFQVLVDNFHKVYKLLLYQLVVILLTGTIFLAFFIPTFSSLVKAFFDSDAWIAVRDLAAKILNALTQSENLGWSTVSDWMQEVGARFAGFISGHVVSITLTVLATLFLFIVYRFLQGLGTFVVGDMLNTRMSCYADVRFFDSFIKNIKTACRFLLVYVPVSFVFDLLTVGICYFVFFFVMSFLPSIATIFLSVTVIVFAETFKLTFTSNLMPCMIEGGMKIRDAIKESFVLKRSKFFRMFSDYLVYLYIVLALNIAIAIFTFASGLLISLPASALWLSCLQFVHYYTATGRKYFITYDTIILNADRGETEKFFENNEMYDKTKMR